MVDNDGMNKVVKVNRIITTTLEKLAGNPMYVFNCSSVIHGIERQYIIKYELHTCKWILFRI